jgi:hypothetical protein
MTHIRHVDVHIAGLNTACPRCRDLAAHPEQLDQAMRTRLGQGIIKTSLDQEAFRNMAKETK